VQGVDQVHVPADVQAQKFFLTNRAADSWKNRMEVSPPAAAGALEEYLAGLNAAAEGERADAPEAVDGVNPSAAPPLDNGGREAGDAP